MLEQCSTSRPAFEEEQVKPTIEAIGLKKRFGKTVALDGLDLVAGRGEVLAVLGPNGAGKSTFIRSLATLVHPDGGEMRVAGFDVRREPEQVRRIIGLAGQFAAVEPTMSGRENLELVARLSGQDAKEARRYSAELLERLGLSDDADRLARTYSGGMRRKLDLGASLVGRPRLLLLDEPTTGLDPRSRLELWDMIRELVGQGTDVLLTTQYLDEADHLADRIVIIDKGRNVASGTPKELKKRAGRNVVEVHVREREQLVNVARALSNHGAGPLIDEATRRVSIAVEAGTDPLRAALDALDVTGAVIDDVSLRQPTLDEVFMALTGTAPATAKEPEYQPARH
jgi:ABC-2 type transport system ATP-binding protein